MMPTIPSTTSEGKGERVTTQKVTAYFPEIGLCVTVPEGYHYRPGVALRLGSMGLIDIFGPTYALEDSSCFHDWLYDNHEKYDITRAEADYVMFCDEAEPYWIRVVAWVLVRSFGWTVW